MIIGTKYFYWVTSGVSFIPTMTSLKGQVKYLCTGGRFEKRVKVAVINISYTLFLLELNTLAVEYF